MTLSDSNVIDKLVKLGLTLREAKIYYALLRSTESTPTDLNRISDVHRTKIYEVLEQMKNKGLCTERKEGSRKYYRATHPREVLSVLSSRLEAEREEREKEQRKFNKAHQKRVDSASEVFEGLASLYDVSTDVDSALKRFEAIRSKDQMHQKIVRLMKRCKTEILSFTRAPYAAADEKTQNEQTEANRAALSRGVIARSIYTEEEAGQLEWLAEGVSELTESGEQARVIGQLPMKMFVFDRKIVLFWLQFMPDLSGEDFTMIAVEDEGFAEACAAMFEHYWGMAGSLPKDTPTA